MRRRRTDGRRALLLRKRNCIQHRNGRFVQSQAKKSRNQKRWRAAISAANRVCILTGGILPRLLRQARESLYGNGASLQSRAGATRFPFPLPLFTVGE